MECHSIRIVDVRIKIGDMKIFFIIFGMLFFTPVFSQQDYSIRINDTTFSAALDTTYRVIINGQRVDIFIHAKDTLTYDNHFYSFKYPKELKVSRVAADQNVDQVMLLDASGTGYLIQAYRTLNPESLTEMLIEQATKENSSYGYTLERTESQKTIKSGQTLRVIRLSQKYKENTRMYEVVTYGKKDSGVAILTFNMNNGSSAPAKDVVQLMWQSLLIK
jgi:hypothetical protein